MPWSKATEKLLEIVDKHLGRFSNPYIMVKEAKATADAKRIIAQGEKDVEDIRNGNLKIIDVSNFEQTKTMELNADTQPSSLTPTQRVFARLAHQEAKKDNNIQKIVAHATEEILANPTDSLGEIDEDIIARIFDEAQYVSKEDLQNVWAGLLAKSILRPEEISIDLIDFLRRLTNKRAEEIASLGSYIFSQKMIVKTEELTKSIPLEFWLKMQNLGLISGVESIGLYNEIPSAIENKSMNGQPYGKKVVFWENEEPNKAIKIPAFVLSELGVQVFDLGVYNPDYNYLRQVALTIKKENPDFNVYLADIDENADIVEGKGKLQYFEPEEIFLPPTN